MKREPPRLEQLQIQEKTVCKNCGLPIEQILDLWGGTHGWHHPTIERETNIGGADIRIHATFCNDDLGEAEP